MTHHTINYVEFPSTDLAATQKFYGDAFGWTFTAWGETYVSFSGAGIDGGFEHVSTGKRKPQAGGSLVILNSTSLETSLATVTAAGGTITAPIFAFPGGRRFHFTDPSGNELGVWSNE